MKKKIVEEAVETPAVEEVLKVAPLSLNLSNQLGQENLVVVVDKLNEVISFLNK